MGTVSETALPNYHEAACGKFIQLRAPIGCSAEAAEEVRRYVEEFLHARVIKTVLEGEQYCIEFQFNNTASAPKFNAFISRLMIDGWEKPIISENSTLD